MMRMAAARKIATNLSARAELVREARALGLNLSEIFEQGLRAAIRERRRTLWLAENRDAIDEYNQRITREGSFADAWRRF